MRRWIVALLLVLGAAPALAAPVTVHLLGTGGPELTPEREGMATLVEANGQMLLFDAGRGVLQNLYLSRIDPARVTRIFLTHLHSDHIEGLPGLWMTPWFLLGRSAKLEVWGPPGTAAMIAGMRAMYGHDLAHRANARFRRADLDIAVHEIVPGAGYDAGGVSVMAFAVSHADGDPALGYRIAAGGHVVVLSGDTTLVPSLVAAGKGADLLVCNIAAVGPGDRRDWRPVLAKLMTTDQAAALLRQTRPKLALLSHIVKKALPGPQGDRVVLARIRAAGYAGPLAMGQDRMSVTIDKAVTVTPPAPVADLPDLDGARP